MRLANRRAMQGSMTVKTLSFVVDRKSVGLPPPTGKQTPRCFWHVAPCGNYTKDLDVGVRLALEYLETHSEEGRPLAPLQWIVCDMPREMSGIEIGFLSVVGAAATADSTAGRRYVERGVAAAAQYELDGLLAKHARRRARVANVR